VPNARLGVSGSWGCSVYRRQVRCMTRALVSLLWLSSAAPAAAQEGRQRADPAYWLSLARSFGSVLRGPFEPYAPVGARVVLARTMGPRWALGAGADVLAAERGGESLRLTALSLLARSYGGPERLFGAIPLRSWIGADIGIMWSRGTAAPVSTHRAAGALRVSIGTEILVAGRFAAEWAVDDRLEVFPRALGISSILHVGAKLGVGRGP